ncbi:MAG: hypothetical protein HP497_10650 [Nitrospira sp.]|nr:hypothetical protein [Nitrospira sp.]
MPTENNFQHDELSRKNPGDRLSTAELMPGAQPESPAWFDTMAQCGTTLLEAGVRGIVFLHGSIQSTDVFGIQRLDEVGGLKRGYSRGVSGLDALLSLMREGENGIPALPRGLTPPYQNDNSTWKSLDQRLGDAGNFTERYVTLAEHALNKHAARPIICSRLLWASEHHHLGRAAAAVRLLADLHRLCERQVLGTGGPRAGRAGTRVSLESAVPQSHYKETEDAGYPGCLRARNRPG